MFLTNHIRGTFSVSADIFNNSINNATVFVDTGKMYTRFLQHCSIDSTGMMLDDNYEYAWRSVNNTGSNFLKILDMGTSSIYSGTTLTIPQSNTGESEWVGIFILNNSNSKNITNIQNLNYSGDFQFPIKFIAEVGSTVSFTPTSVSIANSGDLVMDSLSPIIITGRSSGGDYILLERTYPDNFVYKVGGVILA